MWGKEWDQKNRVLSSPLQPILCQDSTHSVSPTYTSLVFTPLFTPFFNYLPSPLLLLNPSLCCLLIRAGGTIVPLLPLFGNPGLKQTLFTQAVAQPASLQLGQVWLSLFSKCYNKPLNRPPRLIHFPSSIPSTSFSQHFIHCHSTAFYSGTRVYVLLCSLVTLAHWFANCLPPITRKIT